MECPECKSGLVVKNGYSPAGKQKYKCQKCGKQFVENPISRVISDEKKALIDDLLLERILGCCSTPKYKKKEKMRLTLEIDEAWGVEQHTAFCPK